MKRTILNVVAATFLLASCSNNKAKFDATGVFEVTEIIISAENTGKILSFSVEEGDKLQSGATIGIIDTVQLYLQKLQLMKNAKSLDLQRPDIIKQIASLDNQIAQAKKDKQRFENLVKASAANQKDLDDMNARLKILIAERDALNSTLQKSNESLKMQASGTEVQIMQIDDKLAKCRISSPINGVVLNKYANQGEFAATGKPLFKIADIDNMYLRAYVTNEQLATLKTGQKVKVYADKGNKDYKEYAGVITWIASQAEFTPKTIQTKNERENLVYAVKILIKNDGFVKRGMYGEVKF